MAAGVAVQEIPVTMYVSLNLYYNRIDREWFAFWTERDTGFQIGDSWHDLTRDAVLIFRPEIPAARDNGQPFAA